MDEFNKYELLRAQGANAQHVYAAAKADGLDPIISIRLLRQLFGLSLVEAKKATGLFDALNAKQNVVPGAIVYWEGSTAEEGFHIMEARVTKVVDDLVYLDGHKKFRVVDSGLLEVPAGLQMSSMPLRYFEKTLADRISDSVEFWQELSEMSPRQRAV